MTLAMIVYANCQAADRAQSHLGGQVYGLTVSVRDFADSVIRVGL